MTAPNRYYASLNPTQRRKNREARDRIRAKYKPLHDGDTKTLKDLQTIYAVKKP